MYVPSYGLANFFFLCNLTVLLVAVGIWTCNRPLQSAVAVAGVAVGRLLGPEANVNYAFVDPILKKNWGGPLTHMAVIVGALVLVVYPLTHALLVRVCPKGPPPAASGYS